MFVIYWLRVACLDCLDSIALVVCHLFICLCFRFTLVLLACVLFCGLGCNVGLAVKFNVLLAYFAGVLNRRSVYFVLAVCGFYVDFVCGYILICLLIWAWMLDGCLVN